MQPRAIILIVAALVMVGGTVFFARSWLNSERQAIEASRKKPEKVQPKNFVLVAKVNLPAGTFLKKNHMAWQAWPSDSLHSSYLRRRGFQEKSMFGVVVRKHIAAGQPITSGSIVKPGQRGFMAAVLNPGMRAVSISTNSVSSVAGFAFPGDRVDILLTHRIGGRRGRLVSETMMTGVRILAIDQKVTDGNQKAKVGKTVTIEVTPRQAEVMAVAANLGRLSLALRSLKQTEGGKAQILASGVVLDLDDLDKRKPERGTTYTSDAGTSMLLRRKVSDKITITIVRGNKRSSVAFPKGPR
ncbi:MAG: Flp pilus assembly protein CpaB [Alphaproteobacteria bacterium]|nr:Flp pilus assembly protein CpaB [Alphaproteobacteria bacterium]